MNRGDGYYRVWNAVNEFEKEFIRENHDDFFTIEEDKQEDWISDTLYEYLDEWVSSYHLSYKEKMTIISNYGFKEALALVNDLGMNIHDSQYPTDTLLFTIIKEECRINADKFKKEESDE
jgi:hypothetical protein